MKKLVILLACSLAAYGSTLLAAPNQQVTLKMEFESQPNGSFYKNPLHLNNTIKLNPELHRQVIIATQSDLVDDSPVTTTMLVTCRSISANEVSLQFNLVNYGFNRSAALITQPRFVLKNGQVGELQQGLYKIKVRATWDKTA